MSEVPTPSSLLKDQKILIFESDYVPHKGLLYKLRKLVNNQCYIRRNYVQLFLGVPQGSILGPLNIQAIFFSSIMLQQ